MGDKMSIRLDPATLTIGDMEDFEDGVGKPLYEALKPIPVRDEDGKPVLGEPDENGKRRPLTEVRVSAKALRYLIWIVRRTEDPTFTVEDARNVRVGALEILAGDEDGQGNDESRSADNA